VPVLVVVSQPPLDAPDPLGGAAGIACERLRVPLIRLADRGDRRDHYLPGDWHFSPSGHRWVAEAMADFIREVSA
jgi:hypothetical protein